jgi:crotonobetainyl-CoA:carnitine CoA-transferase CaiB-like acyl-CoA transferase
MVVNVISAWTRTRTRAHIIEELAGRVQVGPVNTATDIFADPHVAARNMLTEIELPGTGGTVQLPSPPVHFTATPAKIYRRPPLLDEHRAEILAEAGIGDAQARAAEPGE